MSEIVEHVAQEVESVSMPWVRDNRWSGKGYEIGYFQDETDASEHILATFPSQEEAYEFREAWVREAKARAAIETLLPYILQIVRDQPFYPDTHTGMRQQWVKDQIAEKVAALTSDPTSA